MGKKLVLTLDDEEYKLFRQPMNLGKKDCVRGRNIIMYWLKENINKQTIENLLLEGVRVCNGDDTIKYYEFNRIEIINKEIILHAKKGYSVNLSFKRIGIKQISEIDNNPILFKQICEILINKFYKKSNNMKIYPLPSGFYELTEKVISIDELQRGLKSLNLLNRKVKGKLGL